MNPYNLECTGTDVRLIAYQIIQYKTPAKYLKRFGFPVVDKKDLAVRDKYLRDIYDNCQVAMNAAPPV